MKKYNKGKFCGGNIRSRNQNNTAKKPSREKKIMKSKYLVLLWQSVSDTTTGGNWQWSPARINCLIPDNAKGMVNQSGANAASSMTMRSKFFFTWKKKLVKSKNRNQNPIYLVWPLNGTQASCDDNIAIGNLSKFTFSGDRF